MNKLILIAVLSIVITACSQRNKDAATPGGDIDSSTQMETGSTVEKGAKWNDALIEQYIKQTNNNLILSSNKEETWIFDHTEDTDSATYNIYQIGHHEEDEGGENPRYVTDQWIYINQQTRQLYEYDVANDSLISWSKK